MKAKLAAMLVVVCAIAALYSPSRDAALIWDDHYLVEQDVRCRDDLLGCFGVPYIPQTPFLDVSAVYYRPVVTASFAIVTRLGGAAQGQHLVNIALHALDALLLLALARRFGASLWRAVAGSLLWAFHPRLVEAVTWVSGRTDLLAATFVLGAVLAWPRVTSEPWTDRDRLRVALSSVLVMLGLFAKEVAAAAIVAIVATSLVTGGRRSLRRVAVLGVPVLIYAACRLGVVGTRVPPSSLTTAQHLATIPEAAERYVEMTARFTSPWSLHGAIGVLDVPRVLGGVVVLAAIALIVVRGARRQAVSEGFAAGAALGASSFLAVLHIVPIGLHGAVTGDRLLYLPLAGLVLAVATSLPSARFEKAVLAFACALTLVEAPFARRAQHVFDDEVEFWLTLAERADHDNAGPRSAVATIVRDRGAPELACPLFDAARRVLDRTGRHASPAYGRASENLAACYARSGRYDEAVALFREIARERPASGRVALGLAYALMHAMSFDEASATFAKAARLDPKLEALSTQMSGDVQRAAAERPSLDGPPHARARYLASIGRAGEAERAWLSVAEDPSTPQPLRLEAFAYLAADGSPAAAERAVALFPNGPPALREAAIARASQVRSVMDRRERVVRLGP